MTGAGGPAAQFDFDLARHAAASDIHPDHADDFGRLSFVLSAGPKSQFLFVEYRSQLYRERLILKLNEVLQSAGLRAANFDLTPCATLIEAERSLHTLAASADAIHLIGGDKWFSADRWRELNLRRETLARDLGKRLLFWINPEQVPQLVDAAPDVWAWRGGVYDLVEPDRMANTAGAPKWASPIDNRHLGERSRRMAALREQLRANDIPDLARAMLLDELAGLLYLLGDLDEALRIRRDEELPVYEKLGDVRSRALTLGKMADVFEARGDLDEALRIRRDEQLPVFEKLGDVRSRAVTLGKMADVFQARGDLDEALRIRRDEQLPVFEKLGDVRERAVTLAKMGQALQLKGDIQACVQLWRTAHVDLARMGLPEAKIVQGWLDQAESAARLPARRW